MLKNHKLDTVFCRISSALLTWSKKFEQWRRGTGDGVSRFNRHARKRKRENLLDTLREKGSIIQMVKAYEGSPTAASQASLDIYK